MSTRPHYAGVAYGTGAYASSLFATTNVFTVSVSENVTVIESVSRTWTVVRNGLKETVSLTETFVIFKGKIVEILQSVGIADSVSRSLSSVRTASDSQIIIDSASRTASFSRSVSESPSVREIVSRSWSAIRSFSEHPTVSEAISILRAVGVFTVSLIDQVGIREKISHPLNWRKREGQTSIWRRFKRRM